MTALETQLRLELAAGAMSFARFMALVLYHPSDGYYERDARTLGRAGDFFTSVSVGPLFGELLAHQSVAWGQDLGSDPVLWLEAGAHDGRLASDLLDGWQWHYPAETARFAYAILEPSPRRQAWQRQTLGPRAARVRWFQDWSDLPSTGVRGVLFSNELLDAFPVHRIGWDRSRRAWFEWGVVDTGVRLDWTRLPLPDTLRPWLTPRPARDYFGPLPDGLEAVLPDDFTLEVCPAAIAWWRQAAGVLRQGRLVTLDYGLTGREYFTPERAAGNVRACRDHAWQADLLAHPGEQDLSAPINWTALETAGHAAGLDTERLETQAQFLTRIVARHWTPASPGLDPSRTRQLQTLTHPGFLGQAFRVLVMCRLADGSTPPTVAFGTQDRRPGSLLADGLGSAPSLLV